MKKISSGKNIIVLGATGLLGTALYSQLKTMGLNACGTTRSKRTKDKEFFWLNTADKRSIKAFPWKKFSSIVDCTGIINYGMTAADAEENIETNLLAPMRILAELETGQRYFYCSSHAVLVQEKRHNTYSLSKKTTEQYLRMVSVGSGPQIIILRIPALFSDNNRRGIIHKIKQYSRGGKSLALDLSTECWHTMYVPRVVNAISKLLSIKRLPKTITIGYPLESNIVDILRVAKIAFGRNSRIELKGHNTDHYRPKLNMSLGIKKSDFQSDLLDYYREP